MPPVACCAQIRAETADHGKDETGEHERLG
jgi:hypothetical protein